MLAGKKKWIKCLSLDRSQLIGQWNDFQIQSDLMLTVSCCVAHATATPVKGLVPASVPDGPVSGLRSSWERDFSRPKLLICPTGLKTAPASVQWDSHGSTERRPAVSTTFQWILSSSLSMRKPHCAGDIWTHISSIGQTSDTSYFGAA